MIEEVKEKVRELLKNDHSGHGMDHIERVLKMSLDFVEKEDADKEIVALIALLHDVDDYKLVGEVESQNLSNARRIMTECHVNKHLQKFVCDELERIGFSKRLAGLYPRSFEGMVVSDADMCDALGVRGILRVHEYTLKDGRQFFDRDVFPSPYLTAEEYKKKNANSSVCHIFEKVLKLKDLMLTNSGRKEAEKRHQFVIGFLYQFFQEENADEWISYLDQYLEKEKQLVR